MKKFYVTLFSVLLLLSTIAQDQCSPMGWATEYGNITGGGSATPVVVTNYSQLSDALGNSSVKVVHISGTIDVSGNRITIQDQSNKTIFGLPGSKLVSRDYSKAGSGIFYIKRCTNFILQNIVFEGPGAYDTDGYDNLCIDNCQGFWVDHCEFHDGTDGNFDIKNMSDYVSVTWCTFSYEKPPISGGSGGSDDHRYTNLIGSSASATDDRTHLNTTFQFCWWGNGCRERMPRVRFGKIHLLNNYFSSSVSNYCARAGEEANILLEGNYFENQKTPVDLYKTNAIVAQNNNISTGGSISTQNANSVFDPPYLYDIANPNTIVNPIKTCAGATLPSWGGCSSCAGNVQQPPVVTITNPADGSSFETGSTISFKVSASDADGSVNSIIFYMNGTNFHEEWVAPYDFDYVFSNAGTYKIQAVVTDNDNLSSTTEITINVSSPYNVSVSTQGMGVVEPDISGIHFAGDELTASAIAYIGSRFTGWTGDISSSDKELTFTVNGNISLTANFEAISTASIYEFEDGYYEAGIAKFEDIHPPFSGTGAVNTENTYGSWTELTVYAPQTGEYACEVFHSHETNDRGNVIIQNKTTGASTNVTLPASGSWDVWISTQFTLTLQQGKNVLRFVGDSDNGAPNLDKLEINANKQSYSLTVNQATGGTISPSSGIYSEGDVVSVSATPQSGYIFSNWTGDVTGSTNPTSITIDGDKTISAVFTQEVTKPQVSLKAGWNLLGYPLDGSAELSVALSAIWDKVVCVKDADGFYLKSQDSSLNSLTVLEWGKGYFIQVSEAASFNWR